MDVFMEVIRQFHLCQGSSHGDSKRRQVASGDYNDIVQMLLEAPNFLHVFSSEHKGNWWMAQPYGIPRGEFKHQT